MTAVLLPLFPVLLGAAAVSADTGLVGRAVTLCREIEERFAAFRTLCWTTERVTDTGRMRVREKWVFRFAAPDRIRLDYLEPYERHIIIGSARMWEYLPDARKALCTEFSSPGERQRHITRTLEPVTIPGIRPGDPEDIAARAVSAEVTPEGWIRLECRRPHSVLVLDAPHRLMRGLQVYRGKNLILRSEVLEIQQPAPGFFFPRRMRVVTRRNGQAIISQVEFNGVTVDTDLQSDIFEFHPPEGTKVVGSLPLSP